MEQNYSLQPTKSDLPEVEVLSQTEVNLNETPDSCRHTSPCSISSTSSTATKHIKTTQSRMEQNISLQPAKSALPEVEVLPQTEVNLDETPGSCRPTSARSISSTSSTATKRGRSIFMSKYTINSLYSYRDGAFESALSDSTKSGISAEDGQLVGSWLLTEIDQWDCEQETVVMLTENSLSAIRYDFVKHRIYTQKKWNLKDITTIKTGNLVYPSMSLMTNRDYGGVRVICGSEENAGFMARWNFGGAHNMPYWTFAHHKLIYLEGQEDNARYNVDDFHDALVEQVNKVYSDQKSETTLQDLNEDIVINSYASLTSVIFNQSALGFSKDRGGVNY